MLLCPHRRELLKPPLKLGREVVSQLKLVLKPQHGLMAPKQIRHFALTHLGRGWHREGRMLARKDGGGEVYLGG